MFEKPASTSIFHRPLNTIAVIGEYSLRNHGDDGVVIDDEDVGGHVTNRTCRLRTAQGSHAVIDDMEQTKARSRTEPGRALATTALIAETMDTGRGLRSPDIASAEIRVRLMWPGSQSQR